MLTPRVLPTCLISPTRPMIVNSAIVFMASFLFPSPRAFGSCRRSLGCGSKEVGRAVSAPARHERAEALRGGRGKAAILSREEFGLQAEGENRRMEPLRRGLSGFMAAMKTRETEQGMSVTRPFQFLVCCWLALSFIFFVSSVQTATSCVDGASGCRQLFMVCSIWSCPCVTKP